MDENERQQRRQNRKNHAITIVMALIIGVIATFLGGNNRPRPDGGAPAVTGDGLMVRFLDVGQGDSTLLLCDGSTMLIDGGEPAAGPAVLEELRSLGVERIDVLVCTHPHLDHYGGLGDVVEALPVGTVYAPDCGSDNRSWQALLDTLDAHGLALTVPELDGSFTLGEAVVTVLGPREKTDDLNDMSLVLRVDYGETAFLFTGDAGYASEKAILAAGCDVRCNVLKAGHHGSDTSTCYELLYRAEPDYAVVSCGADNPYGHPHDDTLSRLRDADVTVFRTDTDGTVVCTSDGTDVTFDMEKEAAA